MAEALFSTAGRERYTPSHVAVADLFTAACGMALFLTAGYLWQTNAEVGINLNIAVTGLAGLVFGALGFYLPAISRWTSYGAGLVGLNGIIYYLTVYASACTMNHEMTLVFWSGALASGGLLMQVFVSRQAKEVPEDRREQMRQARGTRVRSRIATGSIVLYVVLGFFAFVALIPFLWMISTSFMTLGETINRAWVPATMQTCNYYEAWDSANFNIYFTNSIVIALTTITGLLVVSILSAYAFAKINFYGRNVIFTMLLATLMVPEIVVMIPNYQTVNGLVFAIPQTISEFPYIEFGRSLGQVTRQVDLPAAVDPAFLAAIPGFGTITESVQEFVTFSWLDTLAVLSIPFMGSAFSIFLLRQFFVQIPHELWEAARIDGAGHLRFLVQVVVPISRPAIMTVALLTFIGSWNSLLWPLLVTRDPELWRPISYGLKVFSDEEAGNQMHLLMAGSFITIFPMLVLYFLTQKTFTEGIATTGLKG